MDEFTLIQRIFQRQNQAKAPLIDLGIGDDAALFRVSQGHQCVVSSDLLVEGQHFFVDVAPQSLGHKALAVNLSDLAAMGARPVGFTLSLGLPRVDVGWLTAFAQGMFALADAHGCSLIGGDTTRSNQVVINVTVFGELPIGCAIPRSGARLGDEVWVSGCLGGAAYALAVLQGKHSLPEDWQGLRRRLDCPMPRLALGEALCGTATAMLDLSDGLAGDVLHILRASGVSARIDCDALPLCAGLVAAVNLPRLARWQYAVAGGEDYELCFTAPAAARAAVLEIGQNCAIDLTCIGTITAQAAHHSAPCLEWYSAAAPQEAALLGQSRGFNHFAKDV